MTPFAKKQIKANFGGGVVVTAADITSALIQDDATAAGIDSGIAAVREKLDPNLVAQWVTFYQGYQKFSADNKDLNFFTLGLPNIGDQVVAYESQLKAWATKLQALGAPMPVDVVTPHEPDPSVNPGWLDKNRTLVTIGVVTIALYAAAPYVLPFLALIPSRKSQPQIPQRVIPQE